MSDSPHPARDLWNEHHPPDGYPAGIVRVPTPISGLAFFPGGYGMWMASSTAPLPTFPRGGVMVVGHDFHSEAGYHASLEAGAESMLQPTWRNLIRLLDDEGIAKERCFFTNIYVGLRVSKTATGKFPGSLDPDFVAHCRALFLKELSIQRPTLILSLGVNVPPFLAGLSSDLLDWGRGRGIRHLDANAPVRSDIVFDDLPDLRVGIVALVHPSLRHATVRHRRYRGHSGAAAESAMLSDVMRFRKEAVDERAERETSERDRFIEKMTDQLKPGEPDAWNKWQRILDGE